MKYKIERSGLIWSKSFHTLTKEPIYHCYFSKLKYNKRNIKQEGNAAICNNSIGLKNLVGEYLKTSEIDLDGFSEDKACPRCVINLNKIRK